MHALQKKKEATVVGNEVKQEDVNGSLDIRLLHHLTLLQHQPFNWYVKNNFCKVLLKILLCVVELDLLLRFLIIFPR
jgi:hypothetical protein